ncbi:MAG: glycosyltransferase family 39 protein [Candidatus Poribacteria bacterium]|nr:glycosyltransferase family 39 protein [Candidatus Poribacteria bacterium]
MSMINQFTTLSPKFRIFYGIVLVLIGCSLLIRGYLLANKWLGPDETQHLHATWAVTQGQLPYRDFWENHTPLLYYCLSPLILLLDEGVQIIFIARGIMFLLVLAILYATYKIAKTCYGTQVAILGVLLLTYMVTFTTMTIETRPDIPITLLELISLYLFIKAFQSNVEMDAEVGVKENSKVLAQKFRQSPFIISGFCLGIAFLFSPKALFPFTALSIAFFIFRCLHRKIRIVLQHTKPWFFFCAAFCSPILLCLVFFAIHGAHTDFIEWIFIHNFTYPDRFSPIQGMLRSENIGGWVMIIGGIFITVRDFMRQGAISITQGTPLVSCLVMAFIYIFLMPAPYPQTQLLFLPLAAMYGGLFLKWIAEKALSPWNNPSSTARPQVIYKFLYIGALTACFFIGIFMPFHSLLSKAKPFYKSNERQLKVMEYVLKVTSPNDVVFDGTGLYVFRPHAYFYCNLVKGVRMLIKNETIPNDIPKNLIEKQCKIVIYDYRIRDLPDDIREFLRENYVKIMDGVYVAGKHLTEEDLFHQPIRFRTFVPGIYTVKTEAENVDVFIDGKPSREDTFLNPGNHTLTFEGNLDEVTLTLLLPK